MGGDDARREVSGWTGGKRGRPIDVTVDGARDLVSRNHRLANRRAIARGLRIYFDLDPTWVYLAKVHLHAEGHATTVALHLQVPKSDVAPMARHPHLPGPEFLG